MANVIRLKRASGSDPAASDLVSGEPAVRTDTGELLFKKDDGSIAKVAGAGGGPDFKNLALRNAANNGAASFPIADFTLVTSGTTSAITPTAANTLLVSVNGVIQKPNTGTSTPSQGFALSGSTIKFGANISAAPDFILYQESGGIGEPSDETVSEEKLKVSNSPVNGYFLSAQSGNNGGLTWAAPVATSCTGNSATATALATARTINGTSFDGTANITVTAAAGTLTGNTLNSSVTASSLTSLGDLSGLTVTGNMAVDTSTLFVNASTNRTGVGTTNPLHKLEVENGTDQENIIVARGADASTEYAGMGVHGGNAIFTGGGVGSTSAGMVFRTAASGNEQERMRIDSSGNVGIGTTSPSGILHTKTSGGEGLRLQGTATSNFIRFSDASNNSVGVIGQDNTFTINNQSNTDMRFKTNDTERMRITSTGKIGIGTTPGGTPANKNAFLAIGDSDTGIVQDGDGQFEIFANAVEVANFNAIDGYTSSKNITTTGNVGIGTTSPATNLHINASSYHAPTGGNGSFTQLIVSNQSAGQGAGIGLLGAGNMVTFINFGDSDDANVGAIVYNNVVDSMQFYVNASQQMNIDSSGNVNIPNDNKKLRLGVHADLEIFHDGGNSYVKHAGTGNLRIETTGGTDEDIYLDSNDDVYLQVADGYDAVKCIGGGAVELYHSGTKKFETTSSGATVTGTVTATAFAGDGSNLTGVDAGFPSGTVMLFVQSSAPTGWTKQTGFNNRALRLVSSGALGGGGGGSTTFSSAFNSSVSTSSGSVHSHTLTTSQIPSHNHTGGAKGIHDAANGEYGTSSQGSVGFPLARYPGSANYDLYTTSSTGGGSGHNHGFTNPNFNLNVSYVDVIYASKD